uniref:Uncharacterized protein n=1 Tax=Strigamia maritima TaxID=126957 RepID=T1IVC8_STRMM
MASSLSDEEFLRIQENLLEVRTTNYNLEECCRRQQSDINTLTDRCQYLDREYQKAQKALLKSKRAKDVELLIQENEKLQIKLHNQEEEFQLQNCTMMQELSLLVSSNEKLEKELRNVKENGLSKNDFKSSQEVGTLENNLRKLQAENTILQKNMTTDKLNYEDEITRLRSSLASIELSSPEDNDIIEVGSKEVSYHKSTNGSIVDVIRQAEERVARLEKELKEFHELKAKYETEEEEKRLLKNELSKVHSLSENETMSLQDEIERLIDKLKKKQESIVQLQNEKETLYAEKTCFDGNFAFVPRKSYETLQATKDQEIQQMKDQNQRLQTHNFSAKTTITALRRRWDDNFMVYKDKMRGKTQSLEEQLTLKETEVNEQSADKLLDLQTENDSLKLHLTESREEINNLSKQFQYNLCGPDLVPTGHLFSLDTIGWARTQCKMSFRKLSEKYKIGKSTVSDVMKKKEDYIKEYHKGNRKMKLLKRYNDGTVLNQLALSTSKWPVAAITCVVRTKDFCPDYTGTPEHLSQPDKILRPNCVRTTQEARNLNQSLVTRANSLEEEVAELTKNLDETKKVADKRKCLMDEMATNMQKKAEQHKDELSQLNNDYTKKLSDLSDKLEDEKLKTVEVEELRVQIEDFETQVQSLACTKGWFERRLNETEESLENTKKHYESMLAKSKNESDETISKMERDFSQEIEACKIIKQLSKNDLRMHLETCQTEKTECEKTISKLVQDAKDIIEDRKIHEKKGASIVKDLKRQLQMERNRAEKLQERLEEALNNSTQTRSVEANAFKPPEDKADRADTSSISSWSLMSGQLDKENGVRSPTPANILEQENNDLVVRVTAIQEEKWILEEKKIYLSLGVRLTCLLYLSYNCSQTDANLDKQQKEKFILLEIRKAIFPPLRLLTQSSCAEVLLCLRSTYLEMELHRVIIITVGLFDRILKVNHLEESNSAMADDLIRKEAIIQYYCMERRADKSSHALSGDKLTVKRVVDFIKDKGDENQREINRKLFRTLEETLTKNMCLQKDLEILSQQLERLGDEENIGISCVDLTSSITADEMFTSVEKVDMVGESHYELDLFGVRFCHIPVMDCGKAIIIEINILQNDKLTFLLGNDSANCKMALNMRITFIQPIIFQMIFARKLSGDSYLVTKIIGSVKDCFLNGNNDMLTMFYNFLIGTWQLQSWTNTANSIHPSYNARFLQLMGTGLFLKGKNRINHQISSYVGNLENNSMHSTTSILILVYSNANLLYAVREIFNLFSDLIFFCITLEKKGLWFVNKLTNRDFMLCRGIMVTYLITVQFVRRPKHHHGSHKFKSFPKKLFCKDKIFNVKSYFNFIDYTTEQSDRQKSSS